MLRNIVTLCCIFKSERMCDKMFLKKSKFRGDFIMMSEKLTIRFGGENDIDLETLSASLSATVCTLKNLADNLINENDFCKFKVLNIEKGSFVIDIEQIIQLAPTIFPYVPTVITAFKDILKIRTFLKGLPPKGFEQQDDKVKIINERGNVYYADTMTVNIYNNIVEKGMAEAVKAVLNDHDRTDLSYEFDDGKGSKETINLDRESLSYLSTPQDVEKFNKEIEENEIITVVKVNKPDLSGKSKWGVTLNGSKISCSISDENFINKVHNNEVHFSHNTKLKIKMIVRYKEADFQNNKSSEIISRNIAKVYEIIND